MPAKPIVYVELPSQSTAESKQFYGSLFGWSFQDFGPEYSAFHDAGLEGGFHAGTDGRPKAPLLVLLTDDLEAMLAQISAAGGTITVPIFAFPGGRRFHFTDPAGNELALMQSD
jgi:predicted enzyme related to lactoylglutathione lyase